MTYRGFLRNSQLADFIRHRYFMLGLCLQKGMPFLVIPITIKVIGAAAYSQYILLFTLVQVIGVIGSVCLAQSVMPFWYGSNRKESLVGSLLLVMGIAESLLSVPIAIILCLEWQRTHLDAGRAVGVALILIYAVCYNLNALALNLLRLRLKQLPFLLSTAITSAVLITLIYSLRYFPGPKLVLFTLANLVALALQSALYFWCAGLEPLNLFPAAQFKTFAADVMRYSWPLTVYTLVALSALTIDKWIARGAFSSGVFSQYVLDFQFSFALSFLSVVIGMYNSQKLCELVHFNKGVELRQNLIDNYLLLLFGSLGTAVAAFCYARFGGISLSRGFWILSAAFTLANCYGINSSLLSAQKRTRRLAVIGIASTAIFVGMLLLLFVWKAITVLYTAYLIYYLAMFLLSSFYVWGALWKTKTPAAPEASSRQEVDGMAPIEAKL